MSLNTITHTRGIEEILDTRGSTITFVTVHICYNLELVRNSSVIRCIKSVLPIWASNNISIELSKQVKQLDKPTAQRSYGNKVYR